MDLDQSTHGRRQLPRAWRWVIALLALVLVVALFYAEEDWRGARAWKRCQQELAAKGEPVSASQLLPAPVPDSENFAMTPFLAPLFQFEPGTQKWRDTNAFAEIQAFPREFSAAAAKVKNDQITVSNSWVYRAIDLKAWAVALQEGTNARNREATEPVAYSRNASEAAEDVLASLAQYDPVIEELRAASGRPYSRFNLKYDFPNPAAVLLPHLAVIKRISQLLQLRACAELAAGKTDAALADMNLMFYLTDSIRDEPILISHLVRIAESQILLQPLAQGIARHRWSDAQLAGFEERLGKFNFLADGRRALEGERVVFGGAVIDYIRTAPNRFNTLSSLGLSSDDRQGGGVDAISAIYALAPGGWLDFEKVNYHRAFEDFLLPVFDPSAHKVSPEAVRRANVRLDDLLKHRGPGVLLRHQFFIGFLLPAVSKSIQRSVYAQTALDEAAVACALERYRLARGAYPDSLDALAPQYIARMPRDIITGEPLKYHRTEDGQYVLYSVGWNEKDDGGLISVNKTGHAVNFEEGDWVWRPRPKESAQ